MLKSIRQASVPRDAFPPTPPGPEGSNGNGLLRVQWASGAWLWLSICFASRSSNSSHHPALDIRLPARKIAIYF